MTARELMTSALELLRSKCEAAAAALDEALASDRRGVMDAAEIAKVTVAAMSTDADDLASR